MLRSSTRRSQTAMRTRHCEPIPRNRSWSSSSAPRSNQRLSKGFWAVLVPRNLAKPVQCRVHEHLVLLLCVTPPLWRNHSGYPRCFPAFSLHGSSGNALLSIPTLLGMGTLAKYTEVSCWMAALWSFLRKMASKNGFTVTMTEVDIRSGKKNDLTRPAVQARWLRLLSNGFFDALVVPPCSTFSRAWGMKRTLSLWGAQRTREVFHGWRRVEGWRQILAISWETLHLRLWKDFWKMQRDQRIWSNRRILGLLFAPEPDSKEWGLPACGNFGNFRSCQRRECEDGCIDAAGLWIQECKTHKVVDEDARTFALGDVWGWAATEQFLWPVLEYGNRRFVWPALWRAQLGQHARYGCDPQRHQTAENHVAPNFRYPTAEGCRRRMLGHLRDHTGRHKVHDVSGSFCSWPGAIQKRWRF